MTVQKRLDVICDFYTSPNTSVSSLDTKVWISVRVFSNRHDVMGTLNRTQKYRLNTSDKSN